MKREKTIWIIAIFILALALLSTTTESTITLDNSSGAYALNGTYTQTIDAFVQNVTWKKLSWTQGNITSIDSSVLAYFDFESNDTSDKTGRYNATRSGNLDCTGSAGVVGNGCLFDGIDDMLTIPSDLGQNYNMSIEMWINISSGALIGVMGSNHSASPALFLRREANGNLTVYRSGISYTTNTTIASAGWKHIIFTQNGSSARIYVNGNLTAAYDLGFTTQTATRFQIGYTQASGAYVRFNLDELVFWNRTLTAEEAISRASSKQIKIRTRTSDDNTTWTNWSNYSTSYQNTTINQSGRYLQYQAFLQTSDNTTTPTLYNVTIEKDMPLSGWINITVGSLTQSCIGYSFCNMQFLFGTGNLTGGLYNVTVLGHNSTAYMEVSNSSFEYHFEEQAASANIAAAVKQVGDMQAGQSYSYEFNVTLNNSEKSYMYNQTLQLKTAGGGITGYNITTNCQENLSYSSNCTTTFNITIPADALIATYPLTWNATWMNRNGSRSSIEGSSNVQVIGNPSFTINTSIINQTSNISQALRTSILINLTGNVNFQPLKANLTGTGATPMPASWMTFTPYTDGTNELDWDAANNEWDLANWGYTKTLIANLTVTNYTAGTYTGLLNISGRCIAADCGTDVWVWREINVTTTIDSDFTVSTSMILANENMSGTVNKTFLLENIGNAPLTNVTINITGINLSWITMLSEGIVGNIFDSITEGSQKLISILIDVGNFFRNTYEGMINITTTEGEYREINFTIDVNPNSTINMTSLYLPINHSRSTLFIFGVNSSGNVKILNLNITYEPGSMPSSWIKRITPNYTSQLLENNVQATTVNVTVPLAQAPGNYTGVLRINSTNVDERTINLTVEVPTDAYWYFTPSSYNVSKNFVLSERGDVANFTITNPGNIDKNYTLSYGQSQIVTVTADCALCSGANPSSIIVTKQNSSVVRIYHSGYGSTVSESLVTISIADVNSTPNPGYIYMILNVTNTPPVITKNETRTDATTIQSYTELNETIMPWIEIADDVLNGVNQTSIVLNVTKPSGSIITYGMANMTTTTIPPGVYQNKVRFNMTFQDTDEPGNYTISFEVADTDSQKSNSTFRFEVYNSTNLSISSAGKTISGINKTHGADTSINITLNNLGLTRAYEINITGIFSAENFTYTGLYITNHSKNSSSTYLLNISAPARALGSYTFTPNITWKNKAGDYRTVQQAAISITVQSNPTFDIVADSQNLILAHGESMINNFTVYPTGNDNLSAYAIQTQAGYDANLTITYSPQSGSGVSLDGTRLVMTNISLRQFADYATTPPRSFIARFTAGILAKTFEMNITTPTDDTWTADRNNITINAVAEQFARNNQTQIRHMGTGGLTLSYIFELTGDITNITRLESSSAVLDANQTYNIPMNYTALRNNNIYYGQLKINATEHDVKYVNITINSGFYDMQVLSIEKPAAIIENDTITANISIYYLAGYLTENITYKMYVNDTECPTASTVLAGNVYTVACTAPFKTDAKTYDLKAFANYSGANGEVDIYITNRTVLYYQDITYPAIIYNQENDTEFGNNITLLANASDNLAVSAITAEITTPSGDKTNYTMQLSSGLYRRSLNMTGTGIHYVKYIVNDTTNNINDSKTADFEIYQDMNFAGIIADQTGAPIMVNFSLTNPASGEMTNFSTNTTGHYNVTIKTRVYDLYMQFENYKANLTDVNFFNLNTSIIQIDRLSAADISGELIGGKAGFSVVTNMPVSGVIELNYNNISITSKDNLRVYSCQDYNYTTRDCGSTWWIQLPSVNNKITNIITSELPIFANQSSAFSLAEVEPAPGPVMSLPEISMSSQAMHGRTTNYSYEVDSIGQTALQNIRTSCTSGTVCTTLNISSDTIATLLPGARGYLALNITVPAGTAPGNYTGAFTVMANSVTDQEVTARIEVLPDKGFTYSFSNTITTVGSNVDGSIGNVTITNSGNILENISFETGTIRIANITSLSPQATASREILYRSPKRIGMNTYEINLTDGVQRNRTNVSINVTHMVNITSISSQNNLVFGGQISLNVMADYLGTQGGANWTASIDGSTCAITSSNLNSFTCTLPSMSARTRHNLTVQGEFMGGHGYDILEVNYTDVFGPEILAYNSSANNTGLLTEVDAVAYDDNGINQSTTAAFITPSGTSILATMSILADTITASASLSELGDYILRYTLYDNLSNLRTTDKEFEFYEERIFSGSIKNTLSEGQRYNLTLYRNGTNTILTSFNTTDDGNYSALIHKRRYDLELATYNLSVRLNSVDLSSIQDPIKIDDVPVNLVSIPNAKDYVVFGFQSEINSTGTITITMNYNSQEINNINNIYIYKCPDWDFAGRECDSNWTAQNGTRGSNTITTNISSFSAYAVAESNLEIPPNTIIYQTTQSITYSTTSGGSSGGSGGGATTGEISSLLDDLKEDIFGRTEAITEAVEEISSKTKDIAIDTSQISRQMYSGENSRTKLHVKNDKNETIQIIAQTAGEITDIISIKNPIIELGKGEEGDFDIGVYVPIDTTPGIYTGEIKLMLGNKIISRIPTEVRVLESKEQLLDLKVQPLSDTTSPGKPAKIQVDVYNLGKSKRVDIQLKLELVDPELDKVISEIEESIAVETTISVIKTLPVPEKSPLGRYLIRGTSYYTNNNKSMHAQSLAYLKIENPWYKRNVFGIIPAWSILLSLLFIALTVSSIEIYVQLEKRKKKYQTQVDYKELPQPGERTTFIGNIAETSVRTFFELDKMQTHSIIAGATGGGKSVAAQVLVEEALKKGAAVIVFDPTAQWTGFLRRSKEKIMLKQYRNFGMKISDSKAFSGNIRPVNNALEVIEIKKFINPGEINIFTINRLDPKDIDIFVANTIKEVFHANLPESQELKLLLVYDEVHRLLPKFGGSGEGFVQIERACREFRKWGVGLVLISQVLSDFIGAIKANIGTEMQMRTRDEGDLERIKTKYGEDIMKSIVKASVGTGMVENAEYNKGRAYFVSFRPLLHSISRLSDEELASYNRYNDKIDDIDYQIEQLEKEGIDVFDLKLELKLALDKLKEGSFSMVDIYLESLEPRLADIWVQIRKTPKKREIRLASITEIKKEIEQAKKDHEKIIKERAEQEKEEEKAKTEKNADGAAKSKNLDDASETTRKNENNPATAPAKDIKAEREKKEEQLRKYISAQIAKKVPKESLKKSLLAHGWKEETISKILDAQTAKKGSEPAKKDNQNTEKRSVNREENQPQNRSMNKYENKKADASESRPAKKASANSGNASIESVEERLSALQMRINELKKQGRDVFILEMKTKTLPSDIKLAKLTKNQESLNMIDEKIRKAEEGLK